MNDDGVLDETTYKSLGVTDEEVVTWYKNMLFGRLARCIWLNRGK